MPGHTPDIVITARPGLVYPNKPVFATVEEERQHRREQLAASFRLFSRFGFSEGVAGHITARDPEFTDHFWVNPFGMHFSQVKASNLILVNHQGEVVHGNRPVNAAAFTIHSQVHAARPDVIAAAHSHSLHGKSLSALHQGIDPITQDACAFFEDHSVFNDYTGVVLTTDEGHRIAQALGNHKALVLANHGLLTVGSTVDSAVWWFITMERSAQAQLLAMAAGIPQLIHPEVARLTHSQLGTEFAGWFQFQSLYDHIVTMEPDLLE